MSTTFDKNIPDLPRHWKNMSWTKEERIKLIEGVKKHGKNYIELEKIFPYKKRQDIIKKTNSTMCQL